MVERVRRKLGLGLFGVLSIIRLRSTELAAALDGRGDDIRRIIAGSRALTERTVENGDDIDRFLTAKPDEAITGQE